MRERAASPGGSPSVSPAVEMDVDDDTADHGGKNEVSSTSILSSSPPQLEADELPSTTEDGTSDIRAEENPSGANEVEKAVEASIETSERTSSPLPRPSTFLDSSDEEAESTPKMPTKSSKFLLRRNVLDDSDDEPDTAKPSDNNDDSFFEKNGLDDLDLLDDAAAGNPRSTIEREIDFRRNMLEDSDDESVLNKDARKSKAKSVDKDAKKNGDSSSDSEVELNGKKKPKDKPERRERQSKKKAMEEMADLHKESQRLARETKVALPYHTAAPLSLDQFFDLMKPMEKPVQKKPSFINIDLGDEDPVAAPPTKLDRFINRFLTHARQPVPKPTTVKPQETKPVVAQQISVESMASMDNLFESMPPADVPVVEKEEPAPTAKDLPKEISLAKQPGYDLPVLASQLQNQKPGAKLSLLKAALEVGINEKKERFIQRQMEEYAKQKALEPQEEEVEEEEEEGEAEFSDDDGESSSGESEPDEAEIVDENYGKEQAEPETNEFVDDEAEEGDDEEDKGDVEEEFQEGDVDVRKESDGSDDEELLNDQDRRAAADDDDDDPLAGLVATQPVSHDSDEDDETSRHFTLEGHGNAPGSLIDDMDPTQRAKLLRLCSFSSQNNLSSQTQSSQAPSSPRFESGSDGFFLTPLERGNNIMGTFDNTEERDELMGLLSCASGDFKTAPPVQNYPALKYDDPPVYPRDDGDEDEPLIRRPQETSKKTAPRRARVLVDDDEEELAAVEQNIDAYTKENAATEAKSILDDEAEEEDGEKPRTKRHIRVEEDSEDEAVDEQDNEEEVDEDDEDEELSQEPPMEDDEEGVQENLERQFKGKAHRVKASDFFEEQAEESEDEFHRGSGDEDEDGMDELNEDDLAAVDDTYFSVSKQLKQAMPEYLRKLAEDDQEREEYLMDRIQALQEDENLPQMPVTYFGDGATFRLNMDGDCVSDEENPDNKEDEVADNAWRVRRFERDQVLASLEVEDMAVEDEDVLLKDNPFSIFSKKIRARENADISFEMQAETSFSDETGGKTIASFKRNSILSRGSAVLARLNEVIDVEERPVMSAAIIALQNGSTRKGLTIDGDHREKLQRTESCPADASDGPSAKRRRIEYTKNGKKPSVFSLLGH